MSVRWRTVAVGRTVAAVTGTVLLVVALGGLTFAQLTSDGRAQVYEEIAKLSYQFLVIVLLGALVKTSVEAAQGAARAVPHLLVRRERPSTLLILSLTAFSCDWNTQTPTATSAGQINAWM
jgi:hypothetical protein